MTANPDNIAPSAQDLVDELGYSFSQPAMDSFMEYVRANNVKKAKALLRNEGYNKTSQDLMYDYCRKEAVGEDVVLTEVPKSQWPTLARDLKYLARVGRRVMAMRYLGDEVWVGLHDDITLSQIGQIWLVSVKT
jgi:hypothetical protein